MLITDLYEAGDANAMLARAAAIKQSGVNLIVLLALSDSGHPAYESKHAGAISSLGRPVFTCTPDQFLSMMAYALAKRDLQSWVAEEDVSLITCMLLDVDIEGSTTATGPFSRFVTCLLVSHNPVAERTCSQSLIKENKKQARRALRMR